MKGVARESVRRGTACTPQGFPRMMLPFLVDLFFTIRKSDAFGGVMDRPLLSSMHRSSNMRSTCSTQACNTSHASVAHE